MLSLPSFGVSCSEFCQFKYAICTGSFYLIGQDASLQREAACTLINLALGSEKQCLDICQKAGVYLVMHISNNNPQLQVCIKVPLLLFY